MALKFGEVTLTEPEALRDEPPLEEQQVGETPEPELPVVVEEAPPDPGPEPRATDRPYEDDTPVDSAHTYFRDSVDLHGAPRAALETLARSPSLRLQAGAIRAASKLGGIVKGAFDTGVDVFSSTSKAKELRRLSVEAADKSAELSEQIRVIADDPSLSVEEKEARIEPLSNQMDSIRGTLEGQWETLREGSPVVRGIEGTQDFLAKRRGVDLPEDSESDQIQELGFTPTTWENFKKDVSDISAAFPALFATLLADSMSDVPEEARTFLDALSKDFSSGEDLSETVLGGAIGGTAPVLYGLSTDPLETFQAAPLVSVLTVVSLVSGLNAAILSGAKGAASVARIGGLRRLTNTLERAGLVEPDDIAALKAAYDRGDIRRVDAGAEQLLEGSEAAAARFGTGTDFEGAAAQFGTEIAEGVDAARRASQRAQAIEEFPGRVGEALMSPLKPIADMPIDPALRAIGVTRGAKKRGKVTIGDEADDLSIKQRTVGDEALTVGDLAKSAAVGFGVGLLGGAPIEAAALAPVLRSLYGIGLDHPQAGRYLAGIERFIRHTSAQRNVSLEQAIRQTTDDAARAKSRLRRIIEDLDRVHKEAEGGESPFRVVGDDWSVVEGTTDVSRKILDDFDKLADEINLGDEAKQLFRNDLGEIASGGAVLLKHPTIRAKVERGLIEGLSDLPQADQARWIAAIGSRIDDIVKSKERGVPVLKFGDEADLFLDQALKDAVENLAPEELSRLKGEVIQDVMLRHEGNVLTRAKQRAYDIEAERGLRDSGLYGQYKEALDAGDTQAATDLYALIMLENRALKGRAINQTLPSFILPNQLARTVLKLHRNGQLTRHFNDIRRQKGQGSLDASELALVDRIVNDTFDDLGRFKERTAKAMLGDDYENMTVTELEAQLKAVNDARASNQKPHLSRGQIQDLKSRIASEIEAPGGAGRYVSDNLWNTEWWHTTWKQSGTLGQRLGNIAKMGLTVLNVPAHVNNNMSNVGLQSSRLGMDPFTYMKTAVSQANRYHLWRNNKARNVSALDNRIYKAIDEMGLADTDLSRAELDAYAVSGLARDVNAKIDIPTDKGVIAQGARLIDKASEAPKKAYRFGDEVAKIDEAYRHFDILDRAVSRLRNGKHLDIDTSPTARTRVRRGDDGELYIGKQKLSKDGKLTEKGQRRLDRVLGASARKQAMDLFIDYGQVPGFIRMLRAAGPLSVVSPFLTWNWKAMGFTGKGLLARSMFPDKRFVSNDASLMAQQATVIASANLRRNLMLSGLRELLHEDRDALNQVVSYFPTMPANHLFAATADPEVVLYDNIDSMNWMGPATSWIEGVVTAASYLQDAVIDTPDIMDERSRLLALRNSGRMMTGRQAGKLLGLQGSAVLPLWDLVVLNDRIDPRSGRQVPWPEVFRRHVFPWLIGGTPTSVLDVAVAASGDVTSDWTSRLQALDEDERFEEEFMRWVIRKLTGVGFRPAALDRKLESYTNKMNRQVDSITRHQDFKLRDIEEKNRDGRFDDILMEKQAKFDRAREVIEKERDDILGEIDFQLDAYGLNKNAGGDR